MMRLKHTLAYFFLVFFALLLTLILIAELAENRIAKIALKQINSSIDASISVNDIDFSLVKAFPDAMVELREVNVSSQADTMAQVERVFVSVEMWPLLDGEFNITEIAVEGGNAFYKVDSSGKTNFDVFLSGPEVPEAANDSSNAPLFLSIEHLELSELFCTYTDDKNKISACLYIDEGLSSIHMDDQNTKAAFKGTLRANNCRYPGTNLHLMDETEVDIDVVYFNDLVSLHSLNIVSDGLQLAARGEVKNQQSIFTDLTISSQELNISELKKYLPDSLLTAYQINRLGGLASFNATLKGEVNDSTLPKIDAQLRLKAGQVGLERFPAIESIFFSGTYTNGELMNNASTSITVDTFSFVSGGSKASLHAQVTNLDKMSYRLKSNVELKLDDIGMFIPDSLVSYLGGRVNLKMATSGVLPDSIDLQYADYLLAHTKGSIGLQEVAVQMNSGIAVEGLSGQIAYQKHSLKADSLRVRLPDYQFNLTDAHFLASYTGQLSHIKTLGFTCKELDVKTVNSRLSGQLQFNNPNSPYYSIDANAALDLAEFAPFVPDSLVNKMSGKVSAQLRSAGSLQLDSLVEHLMQHLFTKGELLLGFDDATVEMNAPLMQVNKLTGHVRLAQDTIRLEDCSGALAGVEFDADSTCISNFYHAFWLNQPDTVKVDAYLNLGDIDFVAFAPLMDNEGATEQAESDVSAEPANYRFQAKGKVTAKSFWYENALFENISALYNMSDSLYIIDQLKIDAFKGTTNSSVKAQRLPGDEMKINFKNTTKGLDINQLLYDFDDFMDYTEEVYISHEQLSGFLSADSLAGQIVFIDDSIVMDKIKLKANLLLEEGRLKDYPITAEMGRDYNIDGLDDLQFKTVDTKMFMTGGAVYAPLTNIRTNTFDISLFGMQEFNLDCQYHLRFYLKEILRKGKTDRIEKKQAKADKQTTDGGTKGLTSLYAVYKIKNGETVKSTLEGKDSQMRNKMKSLIYVKEAFAQLEFHPLIVQYETGVND
ncbi:AsmA family protein [Carboxylicivirga taeanensis]|uniref:AsmA family protein n=1 Tax=Carboxylicivirga taeanensis TaxID=1416875 RepID=UPI003F6E2A93